MNRPFRFRRPRVETPERGQFVGTPETVWVAGSPGIHVDLDEFRRRLARADVAEVVGYARRSMADNHAQASPFYLAMLDELCRRCEGQAVARFAREELGNPDPGALARFVADLEHATAAEVAGTLAHLAATLGVLPYVAAAFAEAATRLSAAE